MASRHEVIDHTADTGLVVHADTVEELFEEAARGLFRTMYAFPEGPAQPREVAASGSTFEELLVAWLSELLFVAEAEHLALGRFRVESVGLNAVKGIAWAKPLANVELEGPPIKAVTYHGLEITHGEGWRARVILDV